jgi:glucose-1-phosphate thymidylyltransferase
MTDKAVILAAGRGTRMRGGPFPPALSPAQREAATRGLKAMIPLGKEPGHPFLAYILSGLADAGFRSVCLVISPGQTEVVDFLSSARPRRVKLESVVQERPLGTAHAVLATEAFAESDSVVMVNGDNLYPSAGLAALRGLPRAGLLGFRKSSLIREGIPAEKIRVFALIDSDRTGALTRIAEKPEPAEAAAFGDDPLVSMNAWLLPPTIFAACRAIGPSARGELELQDAVRYSMQQGERFVVAESEEPVLDLSSPLDIPGVDARLRGIEVRL